LKFLVMLTSVSWRGRTRPTDDGEQGGTHKPKKSDAGSFLAMTAYQVSATIRATIPMARGFILLEGQPHGQGNGPVGIVIPRVLPFRRPVFLSRLQVGKGDVPESPKEVMEILLPDLLQTFGVWKEYPVLFVKDEGLSVSIIVHPDLIFCINRAIKVSGNEGHPGEEGKGLVLSPVRRTRFRRRPPWRFFPWRRNCRWRRFRTIRTRCFVSTVFSPFSQDRTPSRSAPKARTAIMERIVMERRVREG
jgi:hypothetical protein